MCVRVLCTARYLCKGDIYPKLWATHNPNLGSFSRRRPSGPRLVRDTRAHLSPVFATCTMQRYWQRTKRTWRVCGRCNLILVSSTWEEYNEISVWEAYLRFSNAYVRLSLKQWAFAGWIPFRRDSENLEAADRQLTHQTRQLADNVWCVIFFLVWHIGRTRAVCRLFEADMCMKITCYEDAWGMPEDNCVIGSAAKSAYFVWRVNNVIAD